MAVRSLWGKTSDFLVSLNRCPVFVVVVVVVVVVVFLAKLRLRMLLFVIGGFNRRPET